MRRRSRPLAALRDHGDGDAAMTESPTTAPPTTGRGRRPRPRPGGAAPDPSPRPRVAGARREREEAARRRPPVRPGSRPRARPVGGAARDGATAAGTAAPPARAARLGRGRRGAAPRRRRPSRALVARPGAAVRRRRRRRRAACSGSGCNPGYVDSTSSRAARSGVQALYAFDYKDSDGSMRRKLDVLTGDLHDQYKKDLAQGGIIDTYKQVSATTSYQVLDVGLQQVNDAQDTATVVVFGAVRGQVGEHRRAGRPPQGSECQVTPDGAQSCTQTVQVQDDQGRRRLEDQRPHPAHDQLRPRPEAARRSTETAIGVAVPRGAPGWHHGSRTPAAPLLAAPPVPGCGAGRTGPPAWTARSEQG